MCSHDQSHISEIGFSEALIIWQKSIFIIIPPTPLRIAPYLPPPPPITSMLIPLSKWCFAGTTKAFLVKIKDICLLLKGSRLLVLLSINYQFIISLSCLIILSLSSKVIYTHLIKAIGCISYCNANIKCLCL